MSEPRRIKIGHLFPELLNLYGDRGNIVCLMQRCKWRGIQAQSKAFEQGDKIAFSELDIVLLGGGSDREQKIACKTLRSIKKDFKKYVEDGGAVIAICGGYQLLGSYYQTINDKIEGLEIVDIYTDQGVGRLIGNIILKSPLAKMPVVGFENHGGRTYTNEYEPFGEVLYGNGNHENSGQEGIVYNNLIGTYLHGPLLPKNPEIADYFISKALERNCGYGQLEPLEDAEEKAANKYICKRYLK
ncbi:MAG: glutamine amidotransferase [Eggerthellaceae bacterium]|nr:glutamine amidotransferase [Eggerthellaceae bacterium]